MDGYVLSNAVEPYGNGFCQAPSAPSTIYSPGGAPGQLVFRTDDLGKTWLSVGTIAFGEDAFAVDCAVDATNPDVLYVLPGDSFAAAALFKSTDGGHSFAAVGAGLEGLELVRLRTSPTRPPPRLPVLSGLTPTRRSTGSCLSEGSIPTASPESSVRPTAA